MKHLRRSNLAARPGKINLMEILVAAAVLVVLIFIASAFMKSSREKKELAEATKRMQAIGNALRGYTDDSGGLLPLEDVPGTDNWLTAGKPEAAEVWYNVLPKRMGASAVSELLDNPADFYKNSYPLYIPGAPYPKSDKKLKKPYFAFGMNSRLQRKAEDGSKQQGTIASVLEPSRTVAFQERGVTKKEQTSKLQGGFDGAPKANAKNFAARHNQKGLILFLDGSVRAYAFSELVDNTGRTIFPQENLIWTPNPEKNPN